MKNKKMLCILLALTLAAACVLAGCAPSEPLETQNTEQTGGTASAPPEPSTEAPTTQAPSTQPPTEPPTEPPVQTGGSGDMLKLEMMVDVDATGSILYYTEAFVIDKEFVLQSGDKLCYDMTLLNEVGGLGAVDMYVGEGLGDATLRDDPMCVDQNFVRDHPTINLGGLAYNMWYSREIDITDTFVKAAEGKDCKVLIAAELPDASQVAGQCLTVLYDNIRIVRNGETVYTIFADRENTLPETPIYYDGLSASGNTVTTLSIQLDEAG